MRRSPKIFLSYARKDRPLAEQLRDRLLSSGYKVWIDDEQLDLSLNVARQIEAGIRGCDYFVLINSRNAITSRWVKFEISRAVDILSPNRIVPLEPNTSQLVGSSVLDPGQPPNDRDVEQLRHVVAEFDRTRKAEDKYWGERAMEVTRTQRPLSAEDTARWLEGLSRSSE